MNIRATKSTLEAQQQKSTPDPIQKSLIRPTRNRTLEGGPPHLAPIVLTTTSPCRAQYYITLKCFLR